jgi:hypothetical protein
VIRVTECGEENGNHTRIAYNACITLNTFTHLSNHSVPCVLQQRQHGGLPCCVQTRHGMAVADTVQRLCRSRYRLHRPRGLQTASMMFTRAEQQHADPRIAWRTALKSLQIIPHAVANRSMPKEKLHGLASQAEVDCGRAEISASAGVDDTSSRQHLQRALEQAHSAQNTSWVSPDTAATVRCLRS